MFRDSTGTCFTAATTKLVAPSPLVAEALALREAISMAVNLNIPSVIFESDNLCLIEVCRGKARKEQIRGIVNDINTMKNQFQRVEFTWTHREGNEVAHCMASLAAEGSSTTNWLAHPPLSLRRALGKDRRSILEG